MRTAIDVSALVGSYPFREVPHPDPDVLVRVLDREEIDGAWVGYLPGAFHRDPSPGNAALYRALSAHRDRLHPAPAIRPDWPGWSRELARAIEAGARAVRAWPMQWGMGVGHPALRELGHACQERSVPLILTVRFEDSRQRHPMDVTGDLPAAMVRELVRAGTGARVVVVGAGRGFIEEVHWGLTPPERAKTSYDTSWIWGPPEDDFAHLLRTIGPTHFVYGTGWPLRLAQVTRANLALLPPDLAGVSLDDPTRWTARRPDA